MDNQQTNDQFAIRLAEFCINYRWLVLIAVILATLLLGSGAQNLAFNNSYRMFFSESNPELQALDNFLETYSKTDTVLFVLHNPEGDALTPSTAQSIEALTEKAWLLPFASRVDSISNFQHTYSEDDELVVENLIEEADSLTNEDIQQRQVTALKEPLLLGNLISDDARTVAVSVTVNLPEDDLTAIPSLVKEVRELKQWFQQEQPHMHVALSGVVMLNNAFTEASIKDVSSLVPAMYGLLIIMTVVVLRSFLGSLSTLLIIALSSIIAMGTAGFIGIPLNPVSVTAPTIIMTLAIADSIHILVTMLSHYREGNSKNAAIIESVRVNLVPVTLTSLTTVIGFLTLNFSDAPPYWHLGNITAIGIVAAWLLSIIFLPTLLAILPIKPGKQRNGSFEKRVMGKTANWVNRRRNPLLLSGLVIIVLLISALPRIEYSDEFIKYFSEDIQFRQDADFTTENLSGVYILEFSVDSGVAEGINSPEYLTHLQNMVDYIKQQPEVKHVYSYTDIIKRLNKNMHNDDEAFYRIPETQDMAAQYRLLYELSLPYGMDLQNRISLDKSATRVSVIIDSISSIETDILLDRINAWQQNHLPQNMQSSATGTAVMFTYISERNIESMMVGNIIAVVSISLIMLIVLRSFKLGFISLLANSLPVIMMFGIWALLVGKVGMVASTVAASTLGIVVDDTVHFLAKYQRAIKEHGMSAFAAIRYTFETVGVAIVSTTVILVTGFSVLVFSDFQLNQQSGLMSAMTIAIALLFDLFLLPAILLLGKKEASDVASIPSKQKDIDSVNADIE
jgi:predicted RND superfamily exporter protein